MPVFKAVCVICESVKYQWQSVLFPYLHHTYVNSKCAGAEVGI
jgi:hypothetical protein